jgi:sulfatase modifying factor 1
MLKLAKPMTLISLIAIISSLSLLSAVKADVMQFPDSVGSRTIVDLTISDIDNEQILLSWSPVIGATSYNIYHSETPEQPGSPVWSLLANLSSEIDSLMITDAENHGFYYATYEFSQANSMIFVQGSTFSPWSNYTVTLSDYYVGTYEVSQTEYTTVMNASPYMYPGTNNPAENICWFDAVEYCNRLSISEGLTPCFSYGTYGTNPDNWPAGWKEVNSNHLSVSCNWTANGYRLLTEMEYVFAAKGGIYSLGYMFSGSDDPYAVAWFSYNNYDPYGPKPVGTKAANELGTFDMSGNVYEWIWDMYSSMFATGTVTNPTGPTNSLSRVVKGGNWDCGPTLITILSRENDMPANHQFGYTGFRLCKRAE